jgi:hypothetical protein
VPTSNTFGPACVVDVSAAAVVATDEFVAGETFDVELLHPAAASDNAAHAAMIEVRRAVIEIPLSRTNWP